MKTVWGVTVHSAAAILILGGAGAGLSNLQLINRERVSALWGGAFATKFMPFLKLKPATKRVLTGTLELAATACTLFKPARAMGYAVMLVLFGEAARTHYRIRNGLWHAPAVFAALAGLCLYATVEAG